MGHKKHKHKHHHHHSSKGHHHRHSSITKHDSKEGEDICQPVQPFEPSEGAPVLRDTGLSSVGAVSEFELVTTRTDASFTKLDREPVADASTTYDVSISRVVDAATCGIERKECVAPFPQEAEVMVDSCLATKSVSTEGGFQSNVVTATPYMEANIAAEMVLEKDLATQRVKGSPQIELAPPTGASGDNVEAATVTLQKRSKPSSPQSVKEEEVCPGTRKQPAGHRSRSPCRSRRSGSRSAASGRAKEKRNHSDSQQSHSRPGISERPVTRSRRSRSRRSRSPGSHSRSHKRNHRSSSKSQRSRSKSRRSLSRSQRSRSKLRRTHSRSQRSRSKSRRSHSRSQRSYSRPRRSHSRSHSRHRSRSRKRTRRSYSRSRESRSHSVSEHSTPAQVSNQNKGEAGPTTADITTAPSTPAVVPAPADSKQHTISVLVNMCKGLAEKQAEESKEGGKDEDLSKSIDNIRAPFVLAPTTGPGLVFHGGAWKTPSQVALDTRAPAKPLEQLYPVSAGLQHLGNQPVGGANNASTGRATQSIAVGELVAKRLEAAVKLQANPTDASAMQTLVEVEVEASRWCQSMATPGKFTGAKVVKPMCMKDHNTGYQAWAKKSMFKGLAPVTGGFGLKMMKKMGWEEGCPLGRTGQGHVEPIELEVKMDRFGLGTGDKHTPKAPVLLSGVGLRVKPGSKATKLLQGKHPVCVLQEVCVRKQWGVPNYEMVDCAGPDHMKTFLFKVSIPVGTYQPAVSSPNKKAAKAQAALAALQGMGLIGSDGQCIL